ncbi:type I restriction enzyme S subunit [Maribacter vaceletii]|uniref:Type I restriction enzyme S subunit n=1 Tax=Maribacter vaceletii TaxID=1206816 RepID=A0A495EDX4_9FLAO|nr:restriction endonuclease subunit S [Maribacter vaceletii]RKR14851.1 type I restriction enzyme S subunit [Maribacter vaceletii]
MREDWTVKLLEEIVKIGDGNHSGNYPKASEMVSEGIPFIRGTNLIDGKVSPEDMRFISAEKHEILKKGHLKTGDILFTNRGQVGKKAIVDERFNGSNLNSQVAWFRCNEQINNRFLFHFLDSPSVLNYINENTNGTALQQLTIRQIRKLNIAFPTLKEQKQIVALLDKAFTAIDQAKANISTNIENAKELFQSKLNDIFSQKGASWEEKTLKEITTKIGSGATPRGGQASYKDSGISLIRSMNVHDDGFREKKLAFIDDEQASKLDNVTIQKNDVLLNITGASVARCCIVDNSFLPARVNQHVSIIRLKEGIMNYKFLHFALTSKETKNLLLGISAQGATRQAITKVQIENFKISFPSSIDVQDKLVKSLETISKQTIQIESNYTKKLEDLEELKKSILQKAFAGELTNQSVAGSNEFAVNIE